MVPFDKCKHSLIANDQGNRLVCFRCGCLMPLRKSSGRILIRVLDKLVRAEEFDESEVDPHIRTEQSPITCTHRAFMHAHNCVLTCMDCGKRVDILHLPGESFYVKGATLLVRSTR